MVGISEIIIRPGLINVDFADVRTIMGDAGTALMGIGRCTLLYYTGCNTIDLYEHQMILRGPKVLFDFQTLAKRCIFLKTRYISHNKDPI